MKYIAKVTTKGTKLIEIDSSLPSELLTKIITDDPDLVDGQVVDFDGWELVWQVYSMNAKKWVNASNETYNFHKNKGRVNTRQIARKKKPVNSHIKPEYIGKELYADGEWKKQEQTEIDTLALGIEIVSAMKASIYNWDIEGGRIDALSDTELDRTLFTPEEFEALPDEDKERIKKHCAFEKERLHKQAIYSAEITLEWFKEQGYTITKNK